MGLTNDAMRTLATLLLATLMSSTPTTPTGQPGPMQPSDYTPAAQSKVVSWQLKRVPPPSPLYVGVDDLLVVGAASSQPAELVTVNYRLLRAADGVIVPGQFTVTPAADRAIGVQTQQLAEGFLLSASVKAAVATTRGQTFVRAFLGSGPFGAGQPSYMLMADYVTTAMAPAHPNGRVLSPQEGPGFINEYQVANPPGGTDWQWTKPDNTRVNIQSISASFVTDGVAGTRLTHLDVGFIGFVTFVPMPSAAGVPPSTSARITWTRGGAGFLSDGIGHILISWGFPTFRANGQTIFATTVGLDAGDQWSNINVVTEEWLDNV